MVTIGVARECVCFTGWEQTKRIFRFRVAGRVWICQSCAGSRYIVERLALSVVHRPVSPRWFCLAASRFHGRARLPKPFCCCLLSNSRRRFTHAHSCPLSIHFQKCLQPSCMEEICMHALPSCIAELYSRAVRGMYIHTYMCMVCLRRWPYLVLITPSYTPCLREDVGHRELPRVGQWYWRRRA